MLLLFSICYRFLIGPLERSMRIEINLIISDAVK